jgi:hypothetical protein
MKKGRLSSPQLLTLSHNKIKVLKRNAYGYRNFGRFRNRILHMFSYKNDLAKQGR